MRKNLIGIVLSGAMSLGLAGCGHDLDNGEVYDKEHRNAYTYTTVVIIPKGGVIPVVHHVPERYTIKIKKFDERKNEWIEDSYDVSKDRYEHLNIGDYFDTKVSNGGK